MQQHCRGLWSEVIVGKTTSYQEVALGGKYRCLQPYVLQRVCIVERERGGILCIVNSKHVKPLVALAVANDIATLGLTVDDDGCEILNRVRLADGGYRADCGQDGELAVVYPSDGHLSLLVAHGHQIVVLASGLIADETVCTAVLRLKEMTQRFPLFKERQCESITLQTVYDNSVEGLSIFVYATEDDGIITPRTENIR